MLGWCYIYAYGVEENGKLGLRLLQQSESLGNSFALYLLGYCYKEGLAGLVVDFARASQYHQQSSDLG